MHSRIKIGAKHPSNCFIEQKNCCKLLFFEKAADIVYAKKHFKTSLFLLGTFADA